MKLESDLIGNKKKILEICYKAIKYSEDELIVKAIYRNIDPDETCTIGQQIEKIYIYNDSIGADLTINDTLCSDYDKF